MCDIRTNDLNIPPTKGRQLNSNEFESLDSSIAGDTARRKHSEVEVRSIEGSDASVMSLGTRIQMIAILQRNESEQSCGTHRNVPERNQNQTNDISNRSQHQKEERFQNGGEEIDTSFYHSPREEKAIWEFDNLNWRKLLQRNNEVLDHISIKETSFPAQYNNFMKQSETTKQEDAAPEKYFPEEVSDKSESLTQDNDTTSNECNRTSSKRNMVDDKALFVDRSGKNTKNFPIQVSSNFEATKTPDCVLEDIDEESSGAEVESLISDIKSIEGITFNSEEHKSQETNTGQENLKAGQNVLPPKIFKKDDKQKSDWSGSSITASTDSRIAHNSSQNLLNKIVSLPPRKDFLSQKNAIEKILLQNSMRRKETQHQTKELDEKYDTLKHLPETEVENSFEESDCRIPLSSNTVEMQKPPSHEEMLETMCSYAEMFHRNWHSSFSAGSEFFSLL